MSYSIYKITNDITDKVYIGKTIRSPDKRFMEHVKSAISGYETMLYNSMRKYGVDNFKMEVIDETAQNESELSELEKQYIRIFDCCCLDGSDKGYNMTRGGDGLGSDFAKLNVIRQINSGTHPLTSELAKRTNRNRIANGTHHFLNDEWAIDCSDRAKKRVTDGNHNFMGKSGSDLQNELLRQGRHSSQIDGAAKRVTERNLKMVEEGTHPWVGETHSNRMKELAAKRLAEGSHNSQVISKCPYCSKEGKGAAMFRWHFDNCKLKRVE